VIAADASEKEYVLAESCYGSHAELESE